MPDDLLKYYLMYSPLNFSNTVTSVRAGRPALEVLLYLVVLILPISKPWKLRKTLCCVSLDRVKGRMRQRFP